MASLPAQKPDNAWTVQLRVFRALFWREVAEQRGMAGLGFLAGILEPILQISVICFWHMLLRPLPTYGPSEVLFITSGVYPMFMFIHLSSQFRLAMNRAVSGASFPVEHAFDQILARVLLKFLVYGVVGVLLFSAIALFWTPQAVPHDPMPIIEAMTAMALLGLGIGLCNAVISRLVPFWAFIYTPLSRLQVLLAGILYVPAWLSDDIRRVVKWNPVLQGVEEFRMAFYPHYPTLVHMPQVLWGWVLGSLVLGFCLERVFRHKLEQG